VRATARVDAKRSCDETVEERPSTTSTAAPLMPGGATRFARRTRHVVARSNGSLTNPCARSRTSRQRRLVVDGPGDLGRDQHGLARTMIVGLITRRSRVRIPPHYSWATIPWGSASPPRYRGERTDTTAASPGWRPCVVAVSRGARLLHARGGASEVGRVRQLRATVRERPGGIGSVGIKRHVFLAAGALGFLAADGLFCSQSPAFFRFMACLAREADAARRKPFDD
jgi:hypothetical protein